MVTRFIQNPPQVGTLKYDHHMAPMRHIPCYDAVSMMQSAQLNLAELEAQKAKIDHEIAQQQAQNDKLKNEKAVAEKQEIIAKYEAMKANNELA